MKAWMTRDGSEDGVQRFWIEEPKLREETKCFYGIAARTQDILKLEPGECIEVEIEVRRASDG